MSDVAIVPSKKIGSGFVPEEYLPDGKNEFHLRDASVRKPEGGWRNLTADEIETLVKNGNTCDDWDQILVTDRFTPHAIKNSEFFGLVRIGAISDVVLEHHDLRMPTGITGSRIIACDIGDECAVHNVRYLAHYIVGDRVMLLNIDEMHTTNHAKFGNGIVKEGEDEEVRIWIDVMNEVGTRAVLPFEGMTTADAYLWAKFRGNAALDQRLTEITQAQFDPRRGHYGEIGDDCVIKNTRIIKDVRVGACAYIKGANKLKNMTVRSTEAEPSMIGEGVEMVNGIMGLGCRVFYGCKAVRFVMGNNVNLKYGARLIHTVLGDNSTVSCCEILNNLIFPAHEQHHNNSFLTASVVMGQSNLAAGATVGSNHNSRANDGEIQAGRGFWPGLCTTLKHNCRFASFALLAKADYPAEMDIPLPFALVSNDEANDRLLVMPAFWWMYNMYALARNTWKFGARDQRITRTQHIEFDSLAPDTVEEMIRAMRLLEIWTAKAHLRREGKSLNKSEARLARLGRELLTGPAEATEGLLVRGENMERSSREVLILKPRDGYAAYREMIHIYAVRALVGYLEEHPKGSLSSMKRALGGKREADWVNLGGQPMPERDALDLQHRIVAGKLDNWEAIHKAYDKLWKRYPREKRKHALGALKFAIGSDRIGADEWQAALDEAVRIQETISDQVYASRKKDFENPFRRITFRSDEERRAVVGDAEDNSFVQQVGKETRAFKRLAGKMKSRT